MRSIVVLIVIALTSMIAVAQPNRPSPDTIASANGAIVVRPVFHATLALQWNSTRILVDPFSEGGSYSSPTSPSIVLITDVHGDHFDLAALQQINLKNTTIVAPSAVANKLPPSIAATVVVLSNGMDTTIESVHITAIPMYNLPESSTAMHTKGRGNGYVLRMGGKRVYISGDTGPIPEMQSLKGIDIAFLCMNMPYTMTIGEAAAATLAFEPKIVYPYHYRGKDGYSDIQAFSRIVTTGNPTIDVRLRDWYVK